MSLGGLFALSSILILLLIEIWRLREVAMVFGDRYTGSAARISSGSKAGSGAFLDPDGGC